MLKVKSDLVDLCRYLTFRKLKEMALWCYGLRLAHFTLVARRDRRLRGIHSRATTFQKIRSLLSSRRATAIVLGRRLSFGRALKNAARAYLSFKGLVFTQRKGHLPARFQPDWTKV